MPNPQVAARVLPEVADAVAGMQRAGLSLSEVLTALASAWGESGQSVQVLREALAGLAEGGVAEDHLHTLQDGIAAAQADLEQVEADLQRAHHRATSEAATILGQARKAAQDAEARARAAESRAGQLGDAIQVALAMHSFGVTPGDARAVIDVLHEARIGLKELPAYLRRLGGLKAAAAHIQKRIEGANAAMATITAQRDRALAELAAARRNRDLIASEVSSAVRVATAATTAEAVAASATGATPHDSRNVSSSGSSLPAAPQVPPLRSRDHPVARVVLSGLARSRLGGRRCFGLPSRARSPRRLICLSVLGFAYGGHTDRFVAALHADTTKLEMAVLNAMAGLGIPVVFAGVAGPQRTGVDLFAINERAKKVALVRVTSARQSQAVPDKRMKRSGAAKELQKRLHSDGRTIRVLVAISCRAAEIDAPMRDDLRQQAIVLQTQEDLAWMASREASGRE